MDKYQETKEGPNYIKDPNKKIDLEKPIETKTNHHMIDEIPIGQRYQKKEIGYQLINK